MLLLYKEKDQDRSPYKTPGSQVNSEKKHLSNVASDDLVNREALDARRNRVVVGMTIPMMFLLQATRFFRSGYPVTADITSVAMETEPILVVTHQHHRCSRGWPT